MPSVPRPENRVGLRLEIPADYRDRLAIISAQRGRSMAACARQVMMEWIDLTDPIRRRKHCSQETD